MPPHIFTWTIQHSVVVSPVVGAAAVVVVCPVAEAARNKQKSREVIILCWCIEDWTNAQTLLWRKTLLNISDIRTNYISAVTLPGLWLAGGLRHLGNRFRSKIMDLFIFQCSLINKFLRLKNWLQLILDGKAKICLLNRNCWCTFSYPPCCPFKSLYEHKLERYHHFSIFKKW